MRLLPITIQPWKTNHNKMITWYFTHIIHIGVHVILINCVCQGRLMRRRPTEVTASHVHLADACKYTQASPCWQSGLDGCLRDMRCTIMIWRLWVWMPVGSNLGSTVLLSKLYAYLNKIYQLPVHQSVWENVHLNSSQSFRITSCGSSISFPDGWVVATDVSRM